MATIDNLNFKVILDDVDFNKRIKADIAAAKAANVELSALLAARQRLNTMSASDLASAKRALDLEASKARAAAKTAEAQEKVRQAAERTAREHQKVLTEQNKTLAAAERIKRAQRQTAAAADGVTAAYGRQRGVLGQLASMAAAYFSVQGVTRFLGSIIRVTGEFEMQRMALRNIVQDVQGADALFGKLQKLAIQSPYTFSEITSYAKQLSAFSVPLDELYDTTKMLADVSAGLGVDMSRMILAYGQVRSAAFLRGQEVRQFTEAGVPLLQELANQFTELEGRVVSTGEVFDKISKREVPFEMVAKVMKDLTSEGGKFFDMQSVLSETLKGKVMKLKDAYEQMLYSIGEGNRGFFHGIVDTALSAVRNYEDLGRILKEIVIVFGTYKAAALAAWVASGNLLTTMRNLDRMLWRLVNVKMNPYALLASGAAAAGLAIYELTQRHSALRKVREAEAEAENDYLASLGSETSLLEYLWKSLEKTTYGTKEYDDAKTALLKNYGTYLSALDKEKLAIGDLTGMYGRLTASVTKSMQQRFFEAGKAGIDEQWKNGMADLVKDLEAVLNNRGIKEDKGLKQAIWDYILGKNLDEFPDEMKKKLSDAFRLINNVQNFFVSGEMVPNIARGSSTTIDDIRRKAIELAEEVERQKESLRGYFTLIDEESKKATLDPDLFATFQKDVNANLKKAFGETAENSKYYIKQNTVQLEEYIETLRSSYKKLGQSIANASTAGYQDADIKGWKQEMKEIAVAAKTLGISLTETAKAETGDRLTEQQKAQRAEINATVQVVNKLKDAYERLAEAVPGSMLGEAMKSLFPDVAPGIRDNLDYEGQLKALSDRLRQIPGEAENADRILVDMGKDATRAMTNAFKAAEKYADAVEGLASRDFAADGTGVAFEISKAVSDLRSKNAKVDINIGGMREELEAARANELAMKALRIKYGEEFWAKYVEAGDKALDELAAKEKAYNARKTQETLNGLAKRYVSENVGKGRDIDLTNLGQRSLRQIAALRRKIEEAMEGVDIGDLGISEETESRLKGAGLSLDDFGKAVRALLQGDLDRLDDEMKEKVVEGAAKAAKGVSDLGDALVKLGEAGDNAGLAEIGEGLKNISGIFSTTLEGAKSGGAVGALVGFLTGAGSLLVNLFAKEAEAKEKAAQATSDYTNSLVLLKSQIDDTAFSSVWGESLFGKMGEYLAKGRAALEDYSAAVADFKEEMSGWGSLGPLVVAMSNGELAPLMPEIKGLEDYSEALRKAGVSVWDEAGAFDADKAKAYLDANYDIDDSIKSQIQHCIDLKERYDEIQESLDGMVETLTGSLASDMVDSFLDNFKRVGDAVDDLDSAFQNLGETIVKSMLQSYVIDEILAEFGPRVKDMFTRYSESEMSAEEVAAGAGALAEDIRRKTEDAADIINSLLGAFDGVDLLSKDADQSSGTLSDGIKAVTEDTASLLASYINAIRADVSFAKTQREQALEILRTAFPSSPTLAEHLAQIQANTYDTAVATGKLLEEFRGVLAPHSEGGSGVKVVAE